MCCPESIPGKVEFFDEGKAQFENIGMTPKLTFVSERRLEHCGVERADAEAEQQRVFESRLPACM